jgi:hypothetical protein
MHHREWAFAEVHLVTNGDELNCFHFVGYIHFKNLHHENHHYTYRLFCHLF